MNFSNPNAFWLFFLIIVPVLIHLFQFRRFKNLKFSNLYFLSAVNQEEKRSRKLKHLLILATRILLIAFLVLSILKPYWETGAMESQVSLIVLDKTPSTLSAAEGKSNSILEENMSFINQLYESHSQNLAVVDQSGEVWKPYTEGEAQESQSSLKLGRILEENQAVEKILLLSDFQQQMIDDHLQEFQDSATAFVFMPPYQQKPNNVMVDSVWVSPSSTGGENTDLKIRLLCVGADVEINAALKASEQLIGTQQIELQQGSFSMIMFPIKRFSDKNSRNFTLSFEGDQLNFDNDFYFTVLNQERMKVLSLSSSSENEFINTIFENDELFSFRSEALNNFSFQDLDQFDLVLVHVGEQLNSFASEALQAYAATGNHLVVIPQQEFNQYGFLSSLGFNNVEAISSESQAKLRLSAPDVQNPFFSNVFNGIDEKLSMPESRLFMKWSSGQDILSFANSYPFLSLAGPQDNVYAFSSPLSSEYTNFVRHGIFLPIWYKIAFSNMKENQILYFYLDDEVLELSVPDLSAGDIFKLRQGQQELVPDQRLSGKKIELILPQQDIRRGFYDLINTKNDTELTKIALNYPKLESEAQYYTTSDLEELFQSQKNIALLKGYDYSSVSNYIEETKKGFPLWKYFLILALLSLLAEVLIIRFFK